MMKRFLSLFVFTVVAIAIGLLPCNANAGTFANVGTGGATLANEIFGTGSATGAAKEDDAATAWTITATDAAARNIHMVADGTTAISEQTPTATVSVDWTTTTYKDESVTGNLLQLAKNGSTNNVYNIPASTNSDQAYIRIYNTSYIVGTVRGTVYDQTGLLGTAVLVADMASGSTSVFSAADMETLFGTTWTGRARMTIDGEIPSMQVQAFICSATGTITNMSPMAP